MSNSQTSQNIERSSQNIDCAATDGNVRNKTMRSEEVYKGMTFSQLLREWLVWLYSNSPSYDGYREEICFLRGNVSYAYDPVTGERKQSDLFQDRARSNVDPDVFKGEVIFPDTGIFVPVISAFYSVGERYYGTTLDTLRSCQNLCRRDIDEGGNYWCSIHKKGCPTAVDLQNEVVRVESPSFQVSVSQDSLLRERFEMPIEPGTYETFCVARVLFIKGLDDDGSEYRLRFGGYGRGNYISDSVVDFVVSSDGRRVLNPASAKTRIQFQPKQSPPNRTELSPF